METQVTVGSKFIGIDGICLAFKQNNYKQIGNSVCFPVVDRIAQNIVKALV